jgi:2-polyprenyl-3-methyl-5-hydroxy-6-metoxy-1,4-benzoquinol methylase
MADAAQREFFDRLAAPFRARYQKSAAFRERRALFLDTGRAALTRSPGRLCFDLGCGPGVLAQDLSLLGFEVAGVDSSEEMIAQARETAPQARFVVEDLAVFLAKETRQAALIVCSSVLEYLQDPLKVVRLAAARLPPGGTLALSIPNRRSLLRAVEPLFAPDYRKHWGNQLGLEAYVALGRELRLEIARVRHFGFSRSRWLGTLTLLELRRPA